MLLSLEILNVADWKTAYCYSLRIFLRISFSRASSVVKCVVAVAPVSQPDVVALAAPPPTKFSNWWLNHLLSFLPLFLHCGPENSQYGTSTMFTTVFCT